MNVVSKAYPASYRPPGQGLPEPRFRETLGARIRRWVLGSAYALQPKRIGLMPRLTAMTVAHAISFEHSTGEVLGKPPFRKEGLIGISNDLSVKALLSAYRQGVFPVCHLGPMKWWSPAERAVLFFDHAHVEKGTRKLIRRDQFDVTFDHDFAAVMRACAEPRPGKTPLTWLTPRMMQAFWDLHKAGYAHSVEVWDREPQLVGGIFGIAIGGIFFGESQFSRVSDASKIASAFLNTHLAHWGFRAARREMDERPPRRSRLSGNRARQVLGAAGRACQSTGPRWHLGRRRDVGCGRLGVDTIRAPARAGWAAIRGCALVHAATFDYRGPRIRSGRRADLVPLPDFRLAPADFVCGCSCWSIVAMR